jgi:hypothetical protein
MSNSFTKEEETNVTHFNRKEELIGKKKMGNEQFEVLLPEMNVQELFVLLLVLEQLENKQHVT